MASAIHFRIWFTPRYCKSAHVRQMRRLQCSPRIGTYNWKSPGGISLQWYPSSPKRGGWMNKIYFFSAAAFLHSARNFLRSLPWSPWASASLEHSIDSAVRGFCIFLSEAGAIASDLAAGALVCARAGLARSTSEARTAAAVREEIFMGIPQGLGRGGHGCAAMLNRR